MTPPTEPATFPACPACSAQRQACGDVRGATNYEWHIIPAHRISKRARDEQSDDEELKVKGAWPLVTLDRDGQPDVAPDGE